MSGPAPRRAAPAWFIAGSRGKGTAGENHDADAAAKRVARLDEVSEFGAAGRPRPDTSVEQAQDGAAAHQRAARDLRHDRWAPAEGGDPLRRHGTGTRSARRALGVASMQGRR